MDRGQVMLVGSVARPSDGWGVGDVFRNAAQVLGAHASMLPDGEVGDRQYWIHFIARHTYALHPAMVTVTRHTPDDWHPKGYDDRWRFTLREGTTELRFDRLGYADVARESYATFRKLRDDGVIGDGVRFKVALPFIESATRAFIDNGAHLELLWPAYEAAVGREIAEICAAIPHEDLAIQWDLCFEVTAAEGKPVNFGESELVTLPRDPYERLAGAMRRLCAPIPADVWLGLHCCYGSLGHKPGASSDSGNFAETDDLGVCVEVANRAMAAAGRPTQFLHLPVPAANGRTDTFYQPLRRLERGGTRVYLGLIHLHDGVDGAAERMAVARRHLPDFGIATQCGWGRRPPDQSVLQLLGLHREIADATFQSA